MTMSYHKYCKRSVFSYLINDKKDKNEKDEQLLTKINESQLTQSEISVSLSSRDNKHKANVFCPTNRTESQDLSSAWFRKDGSMVDPASLCLLDWSGFRAEFEPENDSCSALQVLKTSVEGIIRLVVHDEFVVHKVETVRSGLVRTRHHLANWRGQRGWAPNQCSRQAQRLLKDGDSLRSSGSCGNS